jgi:hypothetical protein
MMDRQRRRPEDAPHQDASPNGDPEDGAGTRVADASDGTEPHGAAAADRRGYGRRIDCSPDAPRAGSWGGRHR